MLRKIWAHDMRNWRSAKKIWASRCHQRFCLRKRYRFGQRRNLHVVASRIGRVTPRNGCTTRWKRAGSELRLKVTNDVLLFVTIK